MSCNRRILSKISRVNSLRQLINKFLENLDKILLQQIDPVKKAQFFGVFFERIPTYEEIKTGTENKALITGIAELFRLGDPSYHILVCPPGENSNYIFEAPMVLCERLDDLDIENIMTSKQ